MNKNMIAAITNRDGQALSRMAGDGKKRTINDGIERLVDQLFKQLKQVFPAASQTNLKNAQDEAVAKQQWILAFAENGIRTREQLSAGMAGARESGSPFWPSPGQFIKWCREGEYFMLGLPSVAELVKMVGKYAANRGYYASPDNYPWEKPAHYWLVTRLYSDMISRNLTDQQLKGQCEAELIKLSELIKSGWRIPEPRPLIEKKSIPASKQTALKHLAAIKQKLSAQKRI